MIPTQDRGDEQEGDLLPAGPSLSSDMLAQRTASPPALAGLNSRNMVPAQFNQVARVVRSIDAEPTPSIDRSSMLGMIRDLDLPPQVYKTTAPAVPASGAQRATNPVTMQAMMREPKDEVDWSPSQVNGFLKRRVMVNSVLTKSPVG